MLVFVAKWLIVPILFGLLGYYVVGPMVNAAPATKTAATQPVESAEPEPEPTASRKFTGEPAVEVIVEKPKKSKKIRSGPKKRSTEPTKKEEPAPTESAPAPDVPVESDGA